MTLQGTVQWGRNEVAVVDSAHALKDLITRLEGDAKSRPIMVDVIASDGRSLTLGLGRNKAVLSLAGPRGSLPYYASVGDENAKGDISFDYYGQRTDFQLRNAVPSSEALVAAEQFLSGPGLPNAVRWEEV